MKRPEQEILYPIPSPVHRKVAQVDSADRSAEFEQARLEWERLATSSFQGGASAWRSAYYRTVTSSALELGLAPLEPYVAVEELEAERSFLPRRK